MKEKHPIKNDHGYVRNARCVHTKNKERWYCRDREFQHTLSALRNYANLSGSGEIDELYMETIII